MVLCSHCAFDRKKSSANSRVPLLLQNVFSLWMLLSCSALPALFFEMQCRDVVLSKGQSPLPAAVSLKNKMKFFKSPWKFMARKRKVQSQVGFGLLQQFFFYCPMCVYDRKMPKVSSSSAVW